MNTLTKPEWLRIKIPSEGIFSETIDKAKRKTLCTVCVEAQCPNQLECFHRGICTFMLLGPSCTRNCSFCAVGKNNIVAPNPKEPILIADAVHQMGFKYCVLTMVTRDDLPDGGASHICDTVAQIRKKCPNIRIELLISDLAGNWDALKSIVETNPVVINHNVETIKRLYPVVRPQAIYSRSLDLLAKSVQLAPAVMTKSGLMLGLGEKRREVLETMDDLRKAGCSLLTIGQYLAPTKKHHTVVRYVHPDDFDYFGTEALKRGFIGVVSGPLVRSSYRADELYNQTIKKIL